MCRWLSLPIALIMLSGCAADCPPASAGIDQRSYNLGIIGGFSEVVRLGVKELALSEVMSPEEMDEMMEDIQVVADRNEVFLYREPELLVSDLYPADVAEGYDVLLIYTGDTLEKYLAIKNDKKQLIDANHYEGEARKDIARRFGRLLSYPDEVIADLISRHKTSE